MVNLMLIWIVLCADGINDDDLFSNGDVLTDLVFPASSIQDLRVLCAVSKLLSERIKPILVERRLEHEHFIKSKIETIQREGYKILNATSHELINKFVHGFDSALQLMLLRVFKPDAASQNGGVHVLKVDEEERLWLKKQLLELKRSLNDYVSTYDPIKQFLEGLDNTS